MSFGNGGDLLCNFDLSPWIIGCHSSMDLVTTVTGDLALTQDDAQTNRQHLLMWMAIPKGERLNSGIGCCLHDYFHAKVTGNIERRLLLDLKKDLSGVFPDLSIKNVYISNIANSDDGVNEIQIGITLGDDSLEFIANWNNIMNVNEELNNFIYSSGANITL